MTIDAAYAIQCALEEQTIRDLKRLLFTALIRSIDSADRAIAMLSRDGQS